MRRRRFLSLVGGAAVAWPASTIAQQLSKVFRLGYLAMLPGEDATLAKPLLQRLAELGYEDGKNMRFEYRSAGGQARQLPQLAAELLRSDPDVLIAGWGTLTAKATKAATTSIPVVFTSVGDPLGAELIASLNRPGANVTGLTSQAKDVVGKRLHILHEVVPPHQRVAVVLNPDTPFSALALQELKDAAAGRNFDLIEARTARELSEGIEAAIRSGAGGLLTSEDFLVLNLSQEIAERAARARLPTMFGTRASVEAGGLMSYGTDQRQLWRRAAEYVDRILKGVKPGDLPVEQPTKFELVINLKTAKALGVAIPDRVLALADEVIE
jgi:ABC-type uncharacterized transport system substrate-binding protein